MTTGIFKESTRMLLSGFSLATTNADNLAKHGWNISVTRESDNDIEGRYWYFFLATKTFSNHTAAFEVEAGAKYMDCAEFIRDMPKTVTINIRDNTPYPRLVKTVDAKFDCDSINNAIGKAV